MRYLLYFTAEDHHLYSSNGGKLELEAKFSGNDLGVSAFRDYLRGRRGALFAVIADLTGEDFHEEQIPWLRGADREAVVQRRLAQRYRDTRVAFHTVDMADALRALGLRQLPEGSSAEALYVHLAARKPPREQFASSAE